MTFTDVIDPLLKREGGYVNHKNDRGGATNYGVTQTTFSEWLRVNSKEWRDVRSLTRNEAEQIYMENYWIPSKCGQLPASVREIHFDAAVNHGVNRAKKMLQEAAGATPDGAIGPLTLRAVANITPELLKARYLITRYKFYGDIINRDKSQMVFIAGWMNRMSEFIKGEAK